MKITVKYYLIVCCVFAINACNDPLQEEVYSQLDPETHLNTEEGIRSVLYAAYADVQYHGQDFARRIFTATFSSGYGWGMAGTFETDYAVPFRNFTWNSNNGFFSSQWNRAYNAIRNANIVLDNLEKGDFSEELKTNLGAEAKAIRGFSYALLYNYFGPTPLFTTVESGELKKPRATDEEILNQIEQDLSQAAEALPLEQEQYGRITKGGALGVLCKHYLNTRQWQKCADVAKQIIDLGQYDLVPEYKDVFAIENEGNEELLWVHPCAPDPANVAHQLIGLLLPTDYPLLPNQATWAARIYTFDSVIDSFEDDDVRKDVFVTEYVNKAGKTIKGYGDDRSLCLKYEPDPNAVGVNSGHDLPEVRYADILLARAEALNELNGPVQESIDLINRVRTRAHVSSIQLGDFTKESLRDRILQERTLEFFFEAKDREDLLRHDEFISRAVARGLAADEHHKLYPIPQTELDANPLVEQNPGY